MGKQTITNDHDVKALLKSYHLYPVTLDLPFRLDHVNCFMAEEDDGWKVIDAGLHNTETVARWNEELKDKKVTDIIITHYHPDHFGYAGGMQEKTGARLSMTKTDADLGMTSWQEQFLITDTFRYEVAGGLTIAFIFSTRKQEKKLQPQSNTKKKAPSAQTAANASFIQ